MPHGTCSTGRQGQSGTGPSPGLAPHLVEMVPLAVVGRAFCLQLGQIGLNVALLYNATGSKLSGCGMHQDSSWIASSFGPSVRKQLAMLADVQPSMQCAASVGEMLTTIRGMPVSRQC